MPKLGRNSLCCLLSCTVLFFATAAAQGVSETEAAQLRMIEAFEAAASRWDIDTMLTFLTPDMEYVNAGNGHYWRGHEELRTGWSGVMASGGPIASGEARPVVTARTFRQLGSDFAVIVTRYRFNIPDARPRYGITTLVLARQPDEKWLITHSQSTLVTPSEAL